MTKFLLACLFLCSASVASAQSPFPPAQTAPSWTIAVSGAIDGYTTTVCVMVDQREPVCKDYVAMTQHFAIDVPNVAIGQHVVVVITQNPAGGADATPIAVQAGWPLPTPATDIHATAILVIPVPVETVPDSQSNPAP